ncbi:MAG: hypothetical protein L0Y66_18545 [Myxococcaceae bacterium]|nr:hypothetical protein [Myxococcaceae bacterium]
MPRLLPVLALVLTLAACGGGGAPLRTPMTAQQALLLPPEQLEFEAPALRQELFRELSALSLREQGRSVESPVLFPLGVDGALVAAPGLEPRHDLLQAPDAGAPLALTFDGSGERWPEDRRESLQGLSEREAAELVARTLLIHWGVTATGPVQVDRASGAPYAAAYLDGILRINPALLYLATSQGPGSTQP